MPADLPRLRALDGLRGLLAFGVVLSHVAALTYWPPLHPTPNAAQWLTWHLGAPAVDIFFVLSGYVVTRAYDRRTRYLPFLIRRLRRLAPLAVTGVLLGLLVCRPLAALIDSPDTSRGVLTLLREGYSPTDLAGLWSLGLLFPLKANLFNPPLWTLGTEVLASVLTPALLLIARHLGWLAPLAAALLCLTGGLLYGPLLLIPLFVIGAALHTHPPRLGRPALIAVTILGAGALLSRFILGEQQDLFRYVTGLGAAGVILGVTHFQPRALLSRAAQWLGTRSYALYATHFAPLLAGAALADAAGLSVTTGAVLALPATLLLAHVTHHLTAPLSGQTRPPEHP